MPSITFTGSIAIQLTDEARPATVPVSFSGTYVEKSMNDLSYSVAVTNQAIPQGTVTNPKFILIQVTEGSMSISRSVSGTAPIVLTANPSPPPGDVPTLFSYTFSAPTESLYVTTTGPARGRVWLFE